MLNTLVTGPDLSDRLEALGRLVTRAVDESVAQWRSVEVVFDDRLESVIASPSLGKRRVVVVENFGRLVAEAVATDRAAALESAFYSRDRIILAAAEFGETTRPGPQIWRWFMVFRRWIDLESSPARYATVVERAYADAHVGGDSRNGGRYEQVRVEDL